LDSKCPILLFGFFDLKHLPAVKLNQELVFVRNPELTKAIKRRPEKPLLWRSIVGKANRAGTMCKTRLGWRRLKFIGQTDFRRFAGRKITIGWTVKPRLDGC
jgi:hypothetical protein